MAETSTSAPMLQISGLVKRFDGVTALDGVDLTLARGEILGLIGPNGSGKTTLVNCVSGVIKADTGEIALEGRSLGGRKREQRASGGMARTFQTPRLFWALTVRENVLAGTNAAGIEGAQRTERAEELLALLELGDVTRAVVSSLPYGVQRRVEIARALAGSPSVLLLDEPAAGLNDGETARLLELLRRLRAEGSVAILVIDHDMNLIMQASDRVQVLDEGRVIFGGGPDEVFEQPQVVEAYLGTADG